jgi:hypothetical protein
MALFAHERVRPFMHFNNALIWISSVIVTGILSYFLHHYGHDLGTHVVYEEVIAVLTLAFWIPVALLSHSGLRTYSLPTNLIFSYLWLTSFIFTAQDWSRGAAYYNTFFGSYHLKHTAEAFSFLAL